MKQIKLSIILIFLIGIPKVGVCGEFASWWQKTPNKNEICNEKWADEYVIGIKCKNDKVKGDKSGHVISNLTKWYFYKNHIIGTYKNEAKRAFFVFDESTCKKQIFDTKLEFENTLKALHLNPRIWTRWYKSNWGMIFTDGDLGEKLMFIFLKLPILIITTIIILLIMLRTKFNFKDKWNKISLIVVGIIIGRIVLDVFPNSF